MNREYVDSSNIESVGYDESTQTLEIEFKRGDVYEYSGVPENVFIELKGASSVGGYFNKNIRNDYPTSKI